MPRALFSVSKVTVLPSAIPAGADETWKKYFSADTRSLMNPYPFASLKCSTLPFRGGDGDIL